MATMDKTMEVSEVAEASEVTEEITEEITEEVSEEITEVLEYLHKRFPELHKRFPKLDETYLNGLNSNSINAILEAKLADEICSNCDGTNCRLPEKLWRGHYVIGLDERSPAKLRLGATVGKNCKYDPIRGRFGELFRKSGLSRKQFYQTFESLEDVNHEITMARIQAKKAAVEHSNIILAGSTGVGKTHMAAAMAIYAMKENRQAKFCLVNEMLDELRNAARYASDYIYVINSFKMIPCLILDDLGKEKTTDAGLDYLHQIVDYRYRNELQTVVTTNALTVEELSSWGNANFITPMISRLLENGVWVSIRNTDDFRVKIRERKQNTQIGHAEHLRHIQG